MGDLESVYTWATFRGITNEACFLRNGEQRNEYSLITGNVRICRFVTADIEVI
jgi:hypothetical protein